MTVLLLALLLGAPAPVARAPYLGDFRVLDTETVEGVEQIQVAYTSGGLEVRGFVFLPAGDGPHPLVVFNHGGVSGVSADMKWRSRRLVAEGYAVITPAYRGEGGSEGEIEVARGEVDDVLAAARLMAELDRVDGERIALVGSSHGALIGVLAAGRQPAGLRCVASACGVMDVEAWWWWLIANGHDVTDSLTVAVYGRGPDDRPEAFAERRGTAAAADIGVPVLLQYGLADRIVPPEQGTMLVEAMNAARRGPVTYRTYPNLGHAFWFWNDLRYHPQEEIDEAEGSWRDLLAFLEEHLR
jgi:dipeptidyl aminopeptidase/acylaminoacyl peptidase